MSLSKLKLSSALSLCLLSWVFVALCCWGMAVGGGRRKRVVIDTDAGADDAMAIILLLSAEKNLEVVGITTVSGNTGVHNVSKNVLKTLHTAGRMEVPVYVGCEQGMLRSPKRTNYFGYDGFGDFFYPNAPNESSLQKEHASIFLANIVKSNPREITILSIGPLTNVALAAHLNPNFFNDVEEIIVLGGSFQGEGNVSPGVEFNIYSDPEAASFVFSTAPKSLITLLPVETVRKASFSKKWREKVLGSLKSKSMDLLNKAERIALKDESEWLCYDPTAAALLLDPRIVSETISSRPLVEVQGTLARGAMIQDFDQQIVTIITSVDKLRLKSILYDSLS